MISNTISKKHKPYTLDEKKKLCEAWQKTKLSKSQFMRQNSLPSAFFEWCNLVLPVTNNNKDPSQLKDNWLQVVQSDTSKNICSNIPSDPIEFKLTCHTMEFSFCMPLKKIISFIKELNYATTVIR